MLKLTLRFDLESAVNVTSTFLDGGRRRPDQMKCCDCHVYQFRASAEHEVEAAVEAL